MKKSSRNRDLILMGVIGLALMAMIVSSFFYWRSRKTEMVHASYRLTKSLMPEGTASELSVNLGVRLAKAKQYEAAQKIFEEVLLADSSNVSVLNNIAYVAGERGNLTQASEYLRTAIGIAKDCGECFNNLGTLLYRQGKIDEAREMFTKAVTVAPDLLDGKLNLAVLYEEQGEWALALEWYAKAEARIQDPEVKKWVALRTRWMSEISRTTANATRSLANEKDEKK